MLKKLFKLGIGASLVLSMGLTTQLIADGSNNNGGVGHVTQGMSWITIRVPYPNMTLQELAQKYYGDANDYLIIYNANKNIIGKNLKLRRDMEIRIPITDKFTDQPEILGWQ